MGEDPFDAGMTEWPIRPMKKPKMKKGMSKVRAVNKSRRKMSKKSKRKNRK